MRNFKPQTAFVAALAAAITAWPAAAAENSEITALREQLRTLEQKLLVLERKQEIKEEATAAAPPPVVAAAANGFSLTGADKKFQLRIRANLQADARFFVSDNVDGNDTFLIRRLRPSFEGTVYEKFGFRIMPDFAPSNFALLDAYVTYQHRPAFNLLVGKTKSPFDLERLVSQSEMLFIERAYPTSLGPNRDLGVQAFGDLAAGTITYQLAWLNGARDNDNTTSDADDAKEIVGRLFAHPFKNAAGSPLQGLGIGLAYSIGEKNSGAPNSYRTNAQQTFFSWRNTVLNDGEHTRIEPQAYYYYGSLGLIGSWASSKQELRNASGTVSREVDNRAWFAAAHWVLTGEDASYRGVTPAANFSRGDGSWGAFEIAARYGELEIDAAAFPLFADPAASARRARSVTLGANWYLNRSVKASLNVEHTWFDGGASNPVTREDETAVLSRIQLRY